jgi:DNA modification methylase
MLPPFTVLNASEGWWTNRKRLWIELGIKSELGRLDNQNSLASAYKIKVAASSSNRIKKEDVTETPSWAVNSIFDPVLCELLYRWFAPPGGVIVDPFAGGSVRGVVAGYLGRAYTGLDIAAAQVAANRVQADKILTGGQPKPRFIEGDSTLIEELTKGLQADFMFSCPPYADLEVYSDHPDDISNKPYPVFKEKYRGIIKAAAGLLKPDRFACFVVGEARGCDGNYYNFVGDTIQAFKDAGLEYYNEAILVTQAGTLAIRAGKQFAASRKLGKRHQNILVFLKGNAKKAVAACGAVEVDEALFDGLETDTETGGDEYGERL